MESMEKKNTRKEEEALRQPVSLSEDLLMEILVRLPFRSLVRFQSVSKSWRSLTSDARKKLPRRPHVLFHNTYPPTTASRHGIRFVNMLEEAASDVGPTLSFLPPSILLQFVDVCNGLVLGRLHESFITRSSSKSWRSGYAVLNPATRKYVMLPPYNSGGSSSLYPEALWLAFDPDVSFHYNVLRLDRIPSRPPRPPRVFQVAVFSSKNRGWVVAEDRIELDRPIYSKQCLVFFDGVLYFHANWSVIFGFNLQGKFCRRLELPDGTPKPDVSSPYWRTCFGVYGGCFRIAGIVNDEMVVWELEDIQTNKWVLKYTVSVHAMEEKLPSLLFGHPKFVLRSFPFDVDAILLTAGSALFRFDLSTTNMTKVCALRDESPVWYAHSVSYPYVPYYSEDLVVDSEDAELWISSEVNTS